MKARVLEPEEWQRLEHLEVSGLLPLVKAENVRVVAVEDDAGKIVASWTLFQAPHFEGFWVDPEHSKKAGAVRALLRETMAQAKAQGEDWVFTGADSDAIARYIERLGGKELPVRWFILPVGEF